MKLLAVINDLGAGGAERLLLDHLTSKWAPWEGMIACIDDLGPLAAVADQAGIPVRALGHGRQLNVRVVGKLREVISDWKPDLVHLHLPRSGFFGRWACQSFRDLPVVYTEHNVWEIYGRATRAINLLNYHLNDTVIAVSGSVRDSILRHVPSSSLRHPPIVVPNGVDLIRLEQDALPREEARAALGLPSDALIVGNVGNLFLRKGQRYLLEAAARIVARHSRCHFAIIGRGDQYHALDGLRRRLGLAERVSLITDVPNAGRYLRAFDIFTLPSLFEGLPVALLEAMALGLPAVATRVGGLPEVIESGRSGLLVEPGDAAGLAAAIDSLVTRAEDRAAFGQAGRDLVAERFTLKVMVERHLALYSDLLGLPMPSGSPAAVFQG